MHNFLEYHITFLSIFNKKQLSLTLTKKFENLKLST